MKIERYKDEVYKYWYDKVDGEPMNDTAEVPDYIYDKYKAAEKALIDCEIELDGYFK